MGAWRLCVLLAVLVNVKMMVSQPTFGSKIWCNMFCDDDDYDSSDSSSYEDILDLIFDPCSGCDTKKPSKSKTTTTTLAPGMQQPFNLVIPPANGMNVTMSNTGTSWLMNFIPWASKPAAPTAAPAATTAAPATTAAGTTAAAGGNTTAAPTTAKG